MDLPHHECENCGGSGVIITGRARGEPADANTCQACGGGGVVVDFPEGWNPMASAITAYLASLPQQTAEPVAWRWRESAGDAWVVQEASTLPDGVQFQPLYTHPASPPVGGAVKVKPLEWRAIGDQWQADTSIGWYSIRPGDDPDFAADLFLSAAPVASYATETQAKAAAQADYERRILAALEPRASDRGAVIALEALRDIDNRATVPHADQAVGAFNSDDLRADLRWIADRARAAIRKLSEVSHEH